MNSKRLNYPRALKTLFPEYFTSEKTILATHRGYGKHGPIAENTLGAFQESTRRGFKAHELDVRISLDLKAVLFHGPTLEKTTSGFGRLEKQNMVDLEKLDWGNYLPKKAKPVKPLLLEEYLKLFANKVFTNIEIKHDWCIFNHNLENTVIDICKKNWGKGNYIFSSFNLWSLRYLRKALPAAAIGILIDLSPFASLKIAIGRLFVKPDSIHLHPQLATQKRVLKYKKLGYGILVWGINSSEKLQEMKNLGVDIVVTDNMDLCK
ncbi:MAG: glycerophosphodiester phosphodiesterase [Leptospirales bacterium]